MKHLTWAFAALMWFSSVASANQIKASDPDGMIKFLIAEGIDATLGEDDYGDPNIRIKYYRTNFSIYFYGCTDGVACTSIQFYVGYRSEGAWGQEQANVWNKERRFAKAYVTDKGSSRLEYDIHTGDHGLHPDDFVEAFSTWTRTIEQFEEEIAW